MTFPTTPAGPRQESKDRHSSLRRTGRIAREMLGSSGAGRATRCSEDRPRSTAPEVEERAFRRSVEVDGRTDEPLIDQAQNRLGDPASPLHRMTCCRA